MSYPSVMRASLTRRFVLGLAIFLGLSFGAWVVLPREEPPWVIPPDLVLVHPDIPPEQNAYTYFVEAVRLHGTVKKEGGPSGDPEADLRRLEGSEAIIRLLRQAAGCVSCVDPQTDSPLLGRSEPPWFGLDSILQQLCVSARTALGEARHSVATEDVLLMLRVQALVVEGSQDGVRHGMGCLSLRRTLRFARDVARSARCPLESLGRIAHGLEESPSLSKSLQTALLGEYVYCIQLARQLSEGGPAALTFLEERTWSSDALDHVVSGHYINRNRTLRDLTELCRRLLKAASLPFAPLDTDATEKEFRMNQEASEAWIRPNHMGKHLLSGFLEQSDRSLRSMARTEVELSATRIVIALHRYQRREAADLVYRVLVSD